MDRILTVNIQDLNLLREAAKVTMKHYPGTKISIRLRGDKSVFTDAVVEVSKNMKVEVIYAFFKGFYMGIVEGEMRR